MGRVVISLAECDLDVFYSDCHLYGRFTCILDRLFICLPTPIFCSINPY